jgi:general secretion pathway protein D
MSFGSGKEDDPSLNRPMASFDQEPVYETSAKPPVAAVATKPVPGKPAPVAVKPVPRQPIDQQPENQPIDQKPVDEKPVDQKVPAQLPTTSSTPATPVTPVTPVTKVPQVDIVPAPVATAAPAGQPKTTATPPVVQPVVQLPAKPTSTAPLKRGLLQIAAPSGIGVGQQFYVDVKVGDVQGFAGASFVLTYDPIFVDFVSVSEGPFLKKGNQPTIFTTDVASGTLTMNVAGPTGVAGANGNGTIASALFKAKNKGPAGFGFRNVKANTSDGQPIDMLPFSTAVEVR